MPFALIAGRTSVAIETYMKNSKITLQAVIFILLLDLSSFSQDIIKLKILDQAMKCQILETSDSIVIFQKYNSEQILKANIPDIDWYIVKSDSAVNFSGKEIKQEDIDNAYEYKPSPKSNSLNEREYDYLKIKAFPQAIVCSIIGTTDTLITYRQINNDKTYRTRSNDLDWYELHTGTGFRYTKNIITQADLDNAYIYEPIPDNRLGDSTAIIIATNDTLPHFQYHSASIEDCSPVELVINSNPRKVYSIAAEQLLDAGFLILDSNSDLLTLTTDYTNYNPTFFKGFIAATFGAENFMSALSLIIIPFSADSCNLVIRGKVRFTQRPSIIEKALVRGITGHKADDREDQINWIIRQNTDMIRPIEAIANKIKEKSEGTGN